MTAQKKKSNKNLNLEMARRYESVWHYMFAELSDYKRRMIIEEPHGKWADSFAHEVAQKAESDSVLPSDEDLPLPPDDDIDTPL
tara:strand:- start:87 stop:338 length:252 start_codon:yes stop_codon:yes gene_type:complete